MDDDTFMLASLHKIAQQNGDGLVPGLLERLSNTSHEVVHSAEIVRLPGLHERGGKPMYRWSLNHKATVINFPVPKWQRNGGRKSG